MYLSGPLIYGVLLVFWGCWKKYHQVGGLKMEIYFFTVLEATIQKLRLWWGTLVTWCEELTHWKRPWFWEWLKVGGEGDNRGWDGWMASPTQWTWVCVSSRSWWWTGKPGILQSMGLQRVGHDWAAELNWVFSLENLGKNLSVPLLALGSCQQSLSVYLCVCLNFSFRMGIPVTGLGPTQYKVVYIWLHLQRPYIQIRSHSQVLGIRTWTHIWGIHNSAHYVSVLCLVAQSCPSLCHPMDCSLPGFSVLGDSPGKNTGVGCHALLQGAFPTQGSNSSLPHWRQILYQLSHQGSPRILKWVAYPFSRGSSPPSNWTRVSCIHCRRILYHLSHHGSPSAHYMTFVNFFSLFKKCF